MANESGDYSIRKSFCIYKNDQKVGEVTSHTGDRVSFNIHGAIKEISSNCASQFGVALVELSGCDMPNDNRSINVNVVELKDILANAKAHVDCNQRIAAIKCIRNALGGGGNAPLKETKQLVDYLWPKDDS